MPLPRPPGLSPAASDLGLGGGLADQVADDVEEERKKRLARQQQMSLLGPAAMALGLSGNGAVGA